MANVRGVVPNLETARAAVAELQHAGFRESEVGLDALGEGDDGVASGHGDRIAITVTAGDRADLARDVLGRFGAEHVDVGAFPTQEIGIFRGSQRS